MKVKDNELELIIDEKIVKVKVLLKIVKDDKTYLVYTDNTKNENNDLMVEVGVLNKDKITSIKKDSDWLFIRKIINSFGECDK